MIFWPGSLRLPQSLCSPQGSRPKLETTLRCLLFIDLSSDVVNDFFSKPLSVEQQGRIASLEFLYNDVDGDLLRIITNCSMSKQGGITSIPNEVTLRTLELLVEQVRIYRALSNPLRS